MVMVVVREVWWLHQNKIETMMGVVATPEQNRDDNGGGEGGVVVTPDRSDTRTKS